MKSFSLFTLLLLPLAIIATPIPDAAPEAIPEAIPEANPEAFAEAHPEALRSLEEVTAVSSSPRSAGKLFARSKQICKIVDVSSYLHCRTGPSTKYAAHYAVRGGQRWQFSCYSVGQCIDGNCTWDRISWNGGHCYVSGRYTDNHCTMARLGRC